MQILKQLHQNKGYWLAMALLALSLEGSALFYQYILEYDPCVLCIHVRIWVLVLLVMSILGFFICKTALLSLGSHAAMTIVSIGLLERSYQLLGVERGFIESSCSMDLGLPQWIALDSWFPLVFEVHDLCGYTPDLPLGITMAEALMALSITLVLLGLIMCYRQWKVLGN